MGRLTQSMLYPLLKSLPWILFSKSWRKSVPHPFPPPVISYYSPPCSLCSSHTGFLAGPPTHQASADPSHCMEGHSSPRQVYGLHISNIYSRVTSVKPAPVTTTTFPLPQTAAPWLLLFPIVLHTHTHIPFCHLPDTPQGKGFWFVLFSDVL